MKKFITTILKTFVVATMLVGGAVFADAAQFDTNPSDTTGITSIALGDCDECGGYDTEVSANISNPGDSMMVTVFTDYMTKRNTTQPINGARGHYETKDVNGTSSTYTFRTRLSAQNATSDVRDSVRVTNLPSSYRIEAVTGHLENEHGEDGDGDGRNDDICPNVPAYQYYVPLSRSSNVFTGTGTDIGTLSTEAGGWCAQGSIAIKYRITNTEVDEPSNPTTDPISVITQSEQNVGETSARLHGRVDQGDTATVWFALTTGSNPSCSSSSQRVNVSGSYDSNDSFNVTRNGLNSGTRYFYRACMSQDGETAQGNIQDFQTDNEDVVTPIGVNVVTEPESNLDNDSATLNGRLTNGQNVNVSFAYSTFSGVSCNTGTLVNANNSLDATSNFSANATGLQANTKYYYVACGFNQDGNDQGNEESFTTSSNGVINNGSDPVAITEDERDVDEDSAELNGEIDMNDFNDGDVFFVWGTDESDIEDVEDENRYSDVDEDGDRIQKERVENDFDGRDDFSLDVNGLNTNETYYFRICVEYEDNDNDDRLVCGDVERFDTDDDRPRNNNIEIRTDSPRNVTQTVAEMCGTLEEDNGSSQQTWIQFRRSNQNSFTDTPIRQRREGSFCERVSGLTSNTTYLYRACTTEGCAPTRSFRTQGSTIPSGIEPVINTDDPTNIQTNSAILNGTYVANAANATCWYEYGRTAGLGKQTRTYNVNGFGSCTHNFTNLASNTQYCVRAVIQTQFGTDRGATKCFNTLQGTIRIGGPGPTPRPPVVTVVEEDETEIDLLSLGLGLSLVRLEIDNDEDVVTRGDNVEYVIEWENISELDLEDLGLKVVMPNEIQITNISRGRLDADTNTIYFTIDELDGVDAEDNESGDSGRMTVSGVVGRGTIGNLLTAEAELAYDNPVNDAQENARDFDLDEYGTRIAGQTASVFGLTNITFLGWLVILLGLFIIFLVARWLYLEREELRAQAYMSGGYQPNYLGQSNYGGQTHYNNGYVAPQQQPPMYGEPTGYNNAPMAPAAPQQPSQEVHYTPYKPNRG